MSSGHDSARIGMLDGWRALSILLVLAGHWLPIGPGSWALNGAVAASGMALFFTLSGFLITTTLLRDDRVAPFLIRRLFRIVPLAWLAMIVLALAAQADGLSVLANLLFFANLPPARLLPGGEHLWSLCVEMQFYLAAAVIVGLAGRRGLLALPLLGLGVTALRALDRELLSIVTWHRVDEILAGAALALLVARDWDRPLAIRVPAVATLVFTGLTFAAAHSATGWLMLLRPYFAAAAIGCSLYAAPRLMQAVWRSRPARYVAETSYALYVIHGMLNATWLGGVGASTTERYLRRPLLAAATFALAHISTFFYERYWIASGKRLAARIPQRARPPAPLATQSEGQ